MYQFPGNANVQRSNVTLNHGANIAANTVQLATVTVTGVTTNDRVLATPSAAPATGIIVGAARVSGSATATNSAGTVEIEVANITTATVAAGTAVVYNLQVFKL